MNNNLIQWPRAKYWDKAWNPIIGCKPCSPACEHCYAAAQMRRFGAPDFSPRRTTRVNPPRKGVVFCGNMTDLFGEWAMVSKRYLDPIEEYLSETFYFGRSMVRFKQCTYLWLTKRVVNMTQVLSRGKIDIGRQISRFSEMAEWPRFDYGKELMANNYFGFTAENQEAYDIRATQASQGFPAWANLWLSCEPLLGEIDLDFPMIPQLPKWLVVGCESGPNRRPCKLEWVESIVEQCRSAGVPVFVKQLDIGGKCERDIMKFPKCLQIRQVPWAKKGENK